MRRLHVNALRTGSITLDEAQSHHARDVLRLEPGTTVELFDDAGNAGLAEIETVAPRVMLHVDAITRALALPALTIASAVPKGDRADWLVEKLSEIGVTRWVPLRTQRSVVHPEGVSKFDRWRRIALEAAKQSKRSGVMTIDELTPLAQLLKTSDGGSGIVLSTSQDAVPIQSPIANRQSAILYIGPEGGWTDEEASLMQTAGLTAVTLGPTILRVETAAVVAAGVVRCLQTNPS